MNSNRVYCLAVTLLVLSCVPSRLHAQATGRIKGLVTDPSGAVLAGAEITATEQGTGVTRSTVSTATGDYTLPSLPVGSYDLTVEAPGFKAATVSNVTLDVSQQREVNFALVVAGTEQEVEASAAPPLVDTETSTLGGLITGQQVNTLPLNGRDITQLSMLMPGVVAEVDQSLPLTSNPSGNSFVASNGNRGTTGASYMDGLDTSDNEFGGPQMTNFNLDAIDEFKVLQNNYSAEYGRGAGSITLVVSKSGTNSFHGSAFEYLRNSAFDARNWFSTSVPPFHRNEFGGTFGGPILKRKTFFFIQYAGFRQRLGEPLLLAVPTAQERQGIINITGANGQPDQLTIPLNAGAKAILNSYPLPNQPTGALGARTFNVQYSVPQKTDQGSIRIDHRFSEKDSLFARATMINNELPIVDPSLAALQSNFSAYFTNKEKNFGGSETHVFTPTLLNSFKFAYTEVEAPWLERNLSSTSSSFSDGSLANWGPDSAEFADFNGAYIFSDNVSWVKGRHTINMGGEYRHINDDNRFAAFATNGLYVFSPGQPLSQPVQSASGQNDLPAGVPSPSSLISFMEGDPFSLSKGFIFSGWPTASLAGATTGIVAQDVLRYHLNGWIQDDFKVAPKLTLNLGFRYEYDSVPHDANDRLFGIVTDPSIAGGTVFRRAVANVHPLWHPDYHGFGPRFGFAYAFTPKTVVRGGFGIFTNLILSETDDQQALGALTGITPNPGSFSNVTQPAMNVPPLTDLNGHALPPVPGNTKSIPPNTPISLQPFVTYTGGPFTGYLADMFLRNGYTMSGNFTIERQLRGDVGVQASYVTNEGVKLYSSDFPNAYFGAQPAYTPYTLVEPQISEFDLTGNQAHSTYHALQTMIRKTSPSHGLQFQGSYTFSKAIDNATTVFNGPVANSAMLLNNPFCRSCEKSVSAFDIPHRFVANAVYLVPLDRLRFLPGRVRQGWQLTTIFEAQSGLPFTVTSPFGTVQYGTDILTGFQATRPDLIQRPTLNNASGPPNQFFSDAVVSDGIGLGQQFFATPGALANGKQDRPGDLGRNSFRGPGFSNTDFSVIKDTKISETLSVQFRAEAFNLLNQHAFNAPASILGSPGFGTSTSTIHQERVLQFALKLLF